MAIIQKKVSEKKDKVKVEINSEVMSKINEYCKWADVDDIGFFFEESAQFVFSKDKGWKEHQRKTKHEKN
jgi:hypothetical protein